MRLSFDSHHLLVYYKHSNTADKCMQKTQDLIFPFLTWLTRDGGFVSRRLLWLPELGGRGGRRGRLYELGGRGRSLLRVCIIGH